MPDARPYPATPTPDVAPPPLDVARVRSAELRAKADALIAEADRVLVAAVEAELVMLDGVRWTGDAGVSVDRLVTRMGVLEACGRCIVVRPTFDLDEPSGETAWMCVAAIGNASRTAFGASAVQALERAVALAIAEL